MPSTGTLPGRYGRIPCKRHENRDMHRVRPATRGSNLSARSNPLCCTAATNCETSRRGCDGRRKCICDRRRVSTVRRSSRC